MGLEAVTKCLSKGTQLLDLVTKDFKVAVLNIFTEWKKIKRIKLCYNELINRYSHKRYKLETRARDKDHPQEKEMQKSKMAVWGGLTYSCEKKRSEKQKRKGKIYSFKCRVPKKSKERQESIPEQSMQRNRGK